MTSNKVGVDQAQTHTLVRVHSLIAEAYKDGYYCGAGKDAWYEDHDDGELRPEAYVHKALQEFLSEPAIIAALESISANYHEIAWRDLVVGEKILPGDRFLSAEGQWTEIGQEHLEFEDHVTPATRPTQRRV